MIFGTVWQPTDGLCRARFGALAAAWSFSMYGGSHGDEG